MVAAVLSIPDPATSLIAVGATTDPVGSPSIDRAPRAMVLQGDLLYVAAATEFVIVDVSDKTAPVIRGSLPTGLNLPGGLAVSGDTAYLLSSDSRGDLAVIDVADPDAPVVVTRTGDFESRIGVQAVGSLVIVSQFGSIPPGTTRIPHSILFDLSDPLAPMELSRIPMRALLQPLAIGDRLYAPAGDSLQIIDISDPTAPFESGLLKVPVSSLAPNGDLLLGTDLFGLVVLDISVPDQPVLAGSVAIPAEALPVDAVGAALPVAVSGNTAVVRTDVGMQAIDVSDPNAPQLLGQIEGIGLGTLDVPALAAADGYAYLGEGRFRGLAIRIIDLALPAAPVSVGELLDIAPIGPFHSSRLEVVGDLAYLADGAGLRILDVSTPELPVERGSFDAGPSSSNQIVVVGGLAYVASYDEGLGIFDVADPELPAELGRLEGGEWGAAIDVVGSLAYVGSETGLRIVDVSDPAMPVEIAMAPGELVTGIDVVGSLAYVAGWGDDGLQIIDVSNPVAPNEIGAAATTSLPIDIEVVGDRAYLAGRSDVSIEIVDVSDPTKPVPLGAALVTGVTASSIEVVGDTALLSSNPFFTGSFSNAPTWGVSAVDVSDPAAPFLLGGFPTHAAGDATVANGLVYAATSRCPDDAVTSTCELALDVIDFGPEFALPEPTAAAQAAAALLAVAALRRRRTG